jgi:glutamate-5-semialdehyde dehydrogenase
MANSLWADDVELRGDSRTLSVLEPSASSSERTQLLKRAGDDDYDTEFLGMTAAVRVVDDFDEALTHIADHGSNHSEAIVSENTETIDRFLIEVDASAVFANSSTRFNDGGEFGLGAEVAVSTNKLHAYGPMGVKEIMSSKWVVIGDGNVRS